MLKVFSEYFGFSRWLSAVAVGFISVVICFAVFWFVHSAPPRVITISSGPPGSIFETNAMKYAATLASNGVTLKILPSQGSLENLQRLEDPSSKVDVGFVQGGVAGGMGADKLFSLGSISYEPLLVFYRSTNAITMLSQLQGKRLAVGSEGSGTYALAVTLLLTNGIVPSGGTVFETLDANQAAEALLAGKV
ncbi:MAG TPA: TAXI family TRAP transporter solute-binding subunit, partial [Verrucomicrobiae bacterium]|nr:TAXI family TRAP transporter solute-binding subunit [Verrucomicrobiae bacterium]